VVGPPLRQTGDADGSRRARRNGGLRGSECPSTRPIGRDHFTARTGITERAEQLRHAARSLADRNALLLATLHALTTDIERLHRTTTADGESDVTTPSDE